MEARQGRSANSRVEVGYAVLLILVSVLGIEIGGETSLAGVVGEGRQLRTPGERGRE